jgi:hypothetical protein
MCKDWCHEECVGTEKWVQCDMSVDWCYEECLGTERWVQCDMCVDWCREECVGPWEGEFMCSYCLQGKKVVLIVETNFHVCRVLNVLKATFPVLFLQSLSHYCCM